MKTGARDPFEFPSDAEAQAEELFFRVHPIVAGQPPSPSLLRCRNWSRFMSRHLDEERGAVKKMTC